jgi:putative glutamine amidotransferase
MPKPLIGITAYSYDRPPSDWRYDVCYGNYAQVVQKAGGLPVLVPAHLKTETLQAIYSRLDAVMLPGGGDVNPARYQAAADSTVTGVDDLRDNAEFHLAEWSLKDDRPLFGICRGLQVMNVVMGGTLMQDIPSAVGAQIRHNQPRTEPRAQRLHDVTVDADSRLAKIMGATTVPVNSIHHQAIETVAPGVRVTAHAPDGIIEAMEIPDKYYALAVQWHPEDLTDDIRIMRLFSAFIQAAQARVSV